MPFGRTRSQSRPAGVANLSDLRSADRFSFLSQGSTLPFRSDVNAALAQKTKPVEPLRSRKARACARATAYAERLQALDNWARREISSVPAPKRQVLTSHDSLQYIANAYGIRLLSVNGWTNKSEPSAAELAKLTRRMRVEHARVVFLDSITDPRAIRRIAEETGAIIAGTLYGDSLSPAPGEADTYIKMLRHDVVVLKAGMLSN
jgi:ABC-type Zn uptake system ZnuABC Zn-binding protein ZnuA